VADIVNNELMDFVHGTTDVRWKGPKIFSKGVGEFGTGFYTFEDTSWGRRVASEWANRKANQEGSKPILVRVSIPLEVYTRLKTKKITEKTLNNFYERWYKEAATGYELVIGPVGKNAGGKKREANKNYPEQYKFEGSGIIALKVEDVIQL